MTTTIPELEKKSELLQSLIVDYSEKKTELEAVFERLLKNISVLENSKHELDVIEESLSQSISSTSPTSARNKIDIDDLTKELEYKLAKLKAWEEELESSKVSLDKQREEINVAAEFLKKAFLDLDEKKKMYEKEIFDEKEKLKTQFFKLESGMRLLETKESEVFSYKKKLLERNQMLNVKENEIQKLLQKNGITSPENEEKN